MPTTIIMMLWQGYIQFVVLSTMSLSVYSHMNLKHNTCLVFFGLDVKGDL